MGTSGMAHAQAFSVISEMSGRVSCSRFMRSLRRGRLRASVDSGADSLQMAWHELCLVST